jgi:hypothetical protein
MEFITSLPKV